MTILPKKKESRKGGEDHESESRNRNRNRTSRDPRCHSVRSSHQQVENSESSTSHTQTQQIYSSIPVCMNSEDSPSLPLKRQRHNRKSVYGYHHSSSASSSSSSSSRERPSRTASDHQLPHCSKRNTENVGTEKKTDGYNSSDEYGDPPCGQKDPSFDVVEMERNFEHDLREEKGFNIKEMATDGACLFRAVADQIYGDQEMHGVVRRHCMDYMVKNRDFFSQYVTEDFNSYIGRKRNEHSHGNHIEMQALSEMYSRPIEVYQYSTQPINTFHSRTCNSDDTPPIRLSYHGNVHYNSIIDPYNPTVGVGLGLAGYKPGTEEEELLNNCMKESETSQLEQAMLEDKLKATDWETADEDIAEMVARESYLQWLKDNQKSKNDTSSSTASTSAKSHSPPKELSQKSPPRKSPSRKSPPRKSPPRTTSTEHDTTTMTTTTNQQTACCSTNTLPPPQPKYAADWQYSEWDDDSLLAAVMAQSQQDYLQEMERQAPSSSKK